ncbi:hypothetical protein NDU88_002794 [Pleurodeles waltl]|uniref:Uncharacterized protein n=1 Tax=Pleurodeles waltl TaxID=8319 RepID=A0AAV7NIR3_PLEWA|nr:hypothetical protein NDU88_002794 [Pleurodeles waltl]
MCRRSGLSLSTAAALTRCTAQRRVSRRRRLALRIGGELGSTRPVCARERERAGTASPVLCAASRGCSGFSPGSAECEYKPPPPALPGCGERTLGSERALPPSFCPAPEQRQRAPDRAPAAVTTMLIYPKPPPVHDLWLRLVWGT